MNARPKLYASLPLGGAGFYGNCYYIETQEPTSDRSH
jgi:hypothetical protein